MSRMVGRTGTAQSRTVMTPATLYIVFIPIPNRNQVCQTVVGPRNFFKHTINMSIGATTVYNVGSFLQQPTGFHNTPFVAHQYSEPGRTAASAPPTSVAE
jgi:hypothetical protein